jgi:hypothetical protein
LERIIAEDCSNALKLWCDFILFSGVEWRTLGGVLWVQLEQLIYFFTACTWKNDLGKVIVKFGTGPASRWSAQRLT